MTADETMVHIFHEKVAEELRKYVEREPEKKERRPKKVDK
jgi:hypothetical protein